MTEALSPIIEGHSSAKSTGKKGKNSTEGLKGARDESQEAEGKDEEEKERFAGGFSLDEARPIISDVYVTRERSISIFIEPRKAGLIFIPLGPECGKGTAVLRSLRLERPGDVRRRKEEIEQRGENRDAVLFAGNRVERPVKDPVSCCMLFLLFHCLEECETLSFPCLRFPFSFFSRPPSPFVPLLRLFPTARHERTHQFEQQRSTTFFFFIKTIRGGGRKARGRND